MLYKYVGFSSGRKIIDNCSLGFTKPQYFNDPFDLPSYPTEQSENPVADLFAGLHKWVKEDAWARNTGILALTRTPTNPLMWAHYGDQHRGIVVGINTIAAGFTDEKSNLIPAQYGSVIYVTRRPNNPFLGTHETPLEIGNTHFFPSDHYEKLQRLFLHKPICWSYEEEVRVVKCLKNNSGDNSSKNSGYFKIIQVDGRDLHLFHFPKEAIREVYFGVRSNAICDEEVYQSLKNDDYSVQTFKCKLDPENLSVGLESYQSPAEITGAGS